MPLGYFDDAGQGSDVPVHTEDTIGDDHLRAWLALVLLDLLFETGNVTMFEGHDLRLAETATIDDAGMVQLVAENKVPIVDERGNGAGICRQTSLVHQNVLDLFELRQLLLAFDDQARIADDCFDGARPHAELVDSLLGGFLDILASNHAQVVIGSKVHDVLAVDGTCWTLF